MIAAIDLERCAGANCPKCPAVKGCDTRAIIKIDIDEPAFVDRSLCHGCADCVPLCPHQAIEVVEYM